MDYLPNLRLHLWVSNGYMVMSMMQEILRIAGTESFIWPSYRISAKVSRPLSPPAKSGATPESNLWMTIIIVIIIIISSQSFSPNKNYLILSHHTILYGQITSALDLEKQKYKITRITRTTLTHEFNSPTGGVHIASTGKLMRLMFPYWSGSQERVKSSQVWNTHRIRIL